MLLLQNSLEMEDDGFTLIYTYGVKKKKKKAINNTSLSQYKGF